MIISKLISSRVQSLRRKLKVLTFGKTDVRSSIYEAMPFGEDSRPLPGYRAIVCETSERGKMVCVGYINKSQLESVEAGEKRLYSLDSNGELSTYILLRGDGVIEIAGKDDFAVRFSKLKEAFDELKDNHNELLNTIKNWTVVPNDGGLALQTAAASLNDSTADIGPAKVEEVNLPTD